jgi:DNA helicase-2/ATP-dependent DNA helicase PcrA
LEDLVVATGYTQWLRRDEGEETIENNRVSNVRELIRAAGRFPSLSELLDYVDKVVRESNENAKKLAKDENKVTLTTLHRAKGMEWPVVFIIGVGEGILPHGLAEDPEEERRLFYVGVTRAKNRLTLTHVSYMALRGMMKQIEPSSYLYECGLL